VRRDSQHSSRDKDEDQELFEIKEEELHTPIDPVEVRWNNMSPASRDIEGHLENYAMTTEKAP
jgi:hypothetical protein